MDESKAERAMITYTELQLRHHITCSCCGRKTQLCVAAVSTRRQMVTWIQCPRCEGACSQWKWAHDKSLWHKTCEKAPCTEAQMDNQTGD